MNWMDGWMDKQTDSRHKKLRLENGGGGERRKRYILARIEIFLNKYSSSSLKIKFTNRSLEALHSSNILLKI